MVVVRKPRRSARVSARNSARSTENRPIPASPVANTAIPVNDSPIHHQRQLPIPSFVIPSRTMTQEAFDFDGIQYSPYFLTSGDNPGTTIISEILDGNNYNTWRIAMTIALDAKNKLAFVDGSLPRPSEIDSHYRIWSRCNSMVKSWILNSVTKPIYGSILRFNDASEIWKDLMVRFHITNLPRSYQLSQQIWSLQQGSLDLSTYYTKLKTLWDDLDGADSVKTCQNCDCCKANGVRIENTKVIKFLAGLNDTYSNARSQIIMKKNIPDLAGVYHLLDQDYSQRTINPLQNATVFQIAAPLNPPQASINAAYNAQKQNRPMCSYCGFSGHTADRCYKAHGYPPGFKHKSKFQNDKPNHQSKQSGSFKPVVAQLSINDSQEVSGVSGMMNTLSKDQIQGVIAYFNSQLHMSPDQSTTLPSTSGGSITALPGMVFSSSTIGFVGILRATGNVLSSKSWIIDSGATHHVCHDKNLFLDILDILNKSVSLHGY